MAVVNSDLDLFVSPWLFGSLPFFWLRFFLFFRRARAVVISAMSTGVQGASALDAIGGILTVRFPAALTDVEARVDAYGARRDVFQVLFCASVLEYSRYEYVVENALRHECPRDFCVRDVSVGHVPLAGRSIIACGAILISHGFLQGLRSVGGPKGALSVLAWYFFCFFIHFRSL